MRDEILQVMNDWQSAYIADVFTAEQKELLKDVTREFKLKKKADGSWDLVQTGTWKVDVQGIDQLHEASPSQAKKKRSGKK
jgi:hypothetical protein